MNLVRTDRLAAYGRSSSLTLLGTLLAAVPLAVAHSQYFGRNKVPVASTVARLARRAYGVCVDCGEKHPTL